MTHRRQAFVLLLGVFLAGTAATAGTAFARDVYLNGVKLDANVTIKPQTFSGCDVRFDDKGDIYVTAKGYNVTATPAPPTQTAPPPPPPPPPPAPPPAPVPAARPKEAVVDLAKKGVWLVSKQTQRGVVQYDVDVFVNGAFVKKVKSVEDPVVMDISRWIKPGDNRVRLVAQKNVPDKRMSMSPTDTLEVIIGEGILGGSTVNIDRVIVDFTRNASETGQITEEYSVAARGLAVDTPGRAC